MAVGFGIFQEDPINPKKRTCAKLGSITLNERGARFSGKTFSVDGLSRHPKYPGDEEYPPVDPELMDEPKSMLFDYPDKDNQVPGWEKWEPLQLEEFADEIDTRGGYLQLVATTVSDFDKELHHARTQEE
ncbi:hypothetical protein C0993_000592, partial [Termitomyces sp. T159_Od127]